MTRTCKGRTIAENGCWLLVCLFVGHTGDGDRENMGGSMTLGVDILNTVYKRCLHLNALVRHES